MNQKKLFILITIFFGIISIIYSSDKKSSTAVGYKIDGNEIIFTYNPKDYGFSKKKIKSVTVANQINGWSPDAPNWQAFQSEDGIWIFSIKKQIVPSGTQFKFVVNGVHWQQPKASKVPEKHLIDDGFGGFNLVLFY